jgi:predicted nucleic acid-binding protein
MRLLFDTSVLIAGFVASHPRHHSALSWLQRTKEKNISFLVSAHSLMECSAVLTRLPLSPRISAESASYLIRENIEKLAEIVSLSTKDYQSIIKHVTELGLSGGIIYDAIVIQTAKKAKADKILTLNSKDFIRLSPENTEWIITP